MGSYIGIGFVYNGSEKNMLENKLRHITTYLISRNGKLNHIKFSHDKTGNLWTETALANNYEMDQFYSELACGYYGQIDLTCDLFDIPNIDVTIRVDNLSETYFSLLLDIPEAQLIKTHSILHLNMITKKIIEFIYEIYKATNFAYAVCDNEAEIGYSPLELSALSKKVYSVMALPVDDEKISIITSDWHIDGLTPRI